MRLGKTTLVHFGSQVATSVAGFLATFVIARELGADTLGAYAVAVALVFWLGVPSNAVTSAIVKRVSEGREQAKLFSAGVLSNGVLSAILTVLLLAFGKQVDAYIGEEVHTLFALLIVGQIMLSTVLAGLRGTKEVGRAGVLQAVERIVRTVGQIALIVLGYELTGLFIGHVGSLLIASGIGFLIVGIRPGMPTREHFRRIFGYARYSWLGTLKTQAFAWMDTIVLGFFVPSALIGIYEVSWNLASMLALISISVQSTLFPEMSELNTKDDHERIHHYLNEGLVFVGVFTIPGLFGAAVVGPRVLKIYRPEFTQGAVILLILIVARTVAAYGKQLLSAINAVDRPDIAFRINLAFILTNGVLNVGLVALFGWYGAAIATSVSSAVLLITGYVALIRLIGQPDIPYTQIGYEILASALMAVVLIGMVDIIPNNHYATIAVVLLGATIYTAVLLVVSTRIRQKAVALISS